MHYLNTAPDSKAPVLPIAEYHLTTPLEQYDLNFCFPVKALESNAVRLEPFIPSLHAKEGWQFFSSPAGREVYTYMQANRPETFAAYLTHAEKQRRLSDWQEYAIFDKSRRSGPKLAGLISMVNSSVDHLCSELGAVMIFPEFQRTHVNTHAAGLLLQYAFEDLKLRRMQWRATDLNEPSMRAAKRLGFQYEGKMKWDKVIPNGKIGRVVESGGYGTPEAGPGRHSDQLAITWDTWLTHTKQHIETLMARPIVYKA